VPQVLCKITKVLGVRGAQALPEVARQAERPHFLRLFATRLHPGQVAPQSHGLGLTRQKIKLELALSPEVRSQDSPALIGGLLGTPWGRDRAWLVIQERWQALSDKLGVFQGVPGIVDALGSFCTADKATEIRAFFKRNPVPAAARGLRQALERIESCVALDARQSKPLSEWLATAGRQ